MSQAGKRLQRAEHGVERQADRMAQRQRGERVGIVVGATDLQFANRQQLVELERQPLLAVFLDQAESLEVRLVQAERPARHGIGDQRSGQGIGAIHHDLAGTAEDPVLGQVVVSHAVVAIHMVFADVQHGRHLGVEAIAGFQLEARQLQHVQLDVVGQQVERRGAEVAADGDTLVRGHRHFAHQGGHGALRVGTGDGDDRGLRLAGEEIDVTGDAHAFRGGLYQRGGAQRQAGADVEFAGGAEELGVEFAATHFHLRILGTQGGQLRRVLSGIDHGERQAAARQVAHQGHAALAEADNDAEVVGGDQAHALFVLNAASRWRGRSAPGSR